MTYLAALIAFLLVLTGFLLNDWVHLHALAVWHEQQWTLAATGWQGVATYAGIFLMVGMVGGGCIGSLAGARVWKMFATRSDQALEQEKQQVQQEFVQLQQQRMALTQQRHNLADEVAAASAQAQQAAWERLEADQRAKQCAERQARCLAGRLKGAQGKARRLAKRTQNGHN